MYYKFFILTICTLFSYQTSFCQDYKYVYYFDKNLASCPKSTSIFTGKGFVDGKLFRLDYYNNQTSNLFLSMHFTDSSLNVAEGLFTSYNDNLKVEQQGNYKDNEMEGVWKNWDKNGLITDSIIYQNGIKVAYATYKYHYKYKPKHQNVPLKNVLDVYNSKDTLEWYKLSFTDSLKNTFSEKTIMIDNGIKRIGYEVNFIGNKGIKKDYDSLGRITIDSVFDRTIKDAEYIAGETGWKKLMWDNLKPEIPAEKGAPSGTYVVVVKFVINIDGTFTDMQVENDPGFGMGSEALRVLQKMGKWKPAMQYGKPVKAYKRQPISFQIAMDR